MSIVPPRPPSAFARYLAGFDALGHRAAPPSQEELVRQLRDAVMERDMSKDIVCQRT